MFVEQPRLHRVCWKVNKGNQERKIYLGKYIKKNSIVSSSIISKPGQAQKLLHKQCHNSLFDLLNLPSLPALVFWTVEESFCGLIPIICHMQQNHININVLALLKSFRPWNTFPHTKAFRLPKVFQYDKIIKGWSKMWKTLHTGFTESLNVCRLKQQ